MHPVLFYLGPVPIRAYGLFVMLGFVAAAAFAYRRAPRRALDPEFILDLLFPTLVAGIVGARLVYVVLDYLVSPSAYQSDPWLPLRFWQGGLAWHGGLFGGLAAVIWKARRAGVPLLHLMDVAAPTVALGHAIARVGCFLNGCCYGHPTDLPWGCEFQLEGASGWTPPSHPAQLYESAGNLLILGLLLWFDRRARPPGALAWIYFLLYSLLRFIVEFFRAGATARMTPGLSLTAAQIASLVIAGAAAGLLVWSCRRGPAAAGTASNSRPRRPRGRTAAR